MKLSSHMIFSFFFRIIASLCKGTAGTVNMMLIKAKYKKKKARSVTVGILSYILPHLIIKRTGTAKPGKVC